MAFVFDATPKGAAANSYCTVEETDDYFAGELYADEWDDADTPTKQKALVKATRRLERLEYQGDRSAYSGQALKWPRNGIVNPEGFYYDGNVVLTYVRQATALLALYYLRQDPTALVEESLRQFSKLRIAGAIDLEMRDSLPSTDHIPDDVMNLIAPFITVGPGFTRIRRA